MSGCLKGVFRLSVAAFILLFVYFYFTDKEEIIVPEVKIENPSPEPGREVHSFDWDNMRYIYKDEVILSNRTKYLNSRPITNKFREDDEGTN